MKCRLAKRRDGLWTLTDPQGRATMGSYRWSELWCYVWYGYPPGYGQHEGRKKT